MGKPFGSLVEKHAWAIFTAQNYQGGRKGTGVDTACVVSHIFIH